MGAKKYRYNTTKNASNKPYSGAFCNFKGQKLHIWDAEPVYDGEQFCAMFGQVTRIDGETVEVACGDGKIRLIQVEYNGEVCAPSALIQSTRYRLD